MSLVILVNILQVITKNTRGIFQYFLKTIWEYLITYGNGIRYFFPMSNVDGIVTFILKENTKSLNFKHLKCNEK